MSRRLPNRSRRIYRRRRPLPESTRACGRQGVSRARQALEHSEPEQLSFESELSTPAPPVSGARNR